MTDAKAPRTSIVIAVKADNAYLRECLEYCEKLTDQDFEILVITDDFCDLPFSKTRVIPSGPVGPSVKRDLGVEKSQGEIIAFLDDDTYPDPNWLAAAIQVFQTPEVAAVGGPAVTPPLDGDLEKASGLVYSSWLAGGPYVYRYLPRPARDVDDYPTCNLLVRKKVFLAAGGFETCYWPGEDTVVCLKITRDLKQRIYYDPKVLVYHHRRRLFDGHLKQVVSYATHRGYFVKKFPATSLRLGYFLPTFLLLGIVLGWLPALYWQPWIWVWLTGIGLYGFMAILAGLWAPPRRLWLWVAGGIIITQLAYGWYFIRGLVAKGLQEETAG
ncbi:glycosyltransferase [bacterium]|nr:glycosyltransferase [bacterium]